jgi:hypothetical protein
VCGLLWTIPARERWSRENAGNYSDLICTRVVEGRGEGCGFSYLLESHMTYLAGSHVLRSWPGIQLKQQRDEQQSLYEEHQNWKEYFKERILLV